MAATLPSAQSRDRYTNAFNSKIFEPLGDHEDSRFVPAGKRRDQSTAEMFGTYNDKDLRSMPKTFQPKDESLTAREKKLNFLSSEVVHGPRPVYHNYGGYPGQQPMSARGGRPDYMDADTEEAIDPKMRRQLEHCSELFGRETPAANHDQVHDTSRRLTPSSFKWFSIPEKLGTVADPHDDMTHTERHYNEKCSQLFDHASPEANFKQDVRKDERTAKEEEAVGDLKRRHNVYYSDLFDRQTPMGMPDQHGDSYWRPKQQCNPEDLITRHQDWTDSKTELACGSARAGRNSQHRETTTQTRKSNELHQSRCFGPRGDYAPKEELDPVITDNSRKIKETFGMHTQHIHQAHLRTSLTSPDFYEEAASTKHWEVVELHISGLSCDTDENFVRSLCTGFDLQIVKVSVEMDPVRLLCKGRAKIMVRYNPKRDSISGLVQKLEATKLRVEV